jgi:hypothetical protein
VVPTGGPAEDALKPVLQRLDQLAGALDRLEPVDELAVERSSAARISAPPRGHDLVAADRGDELVAAHPNVAVDGRLAASRRSQTP